MEQLLLNQSNSDYGKVLFHAEPLGDDPPLRLYPNYACGLGTYVVGQKFVKGEWETLKSGFPPSREIYDRRPGFIHVGFRVFCAYNDRQN